MESTPIQISHNRLVRLKLIEENHQQFLKDQKRYFIYEIDDNKWQNVNPDGSNDDDLEFIKQEKALLPIGILAVNQIDNSFSFEGDLTVTKEDQLVIFKSINY
ncbi:MAG: hypothetical protein EOP42_01675 [Sphingobacteriaceae bacterium]|nr:MAG: hypothetical protein EOP42_01675 [Sphingobacteriaceae bacterium]